eukprot:TRINITY_DN1807_c0_g1_i1.p1 TRINITY_DN1807_c0_g1~~TRINITY_DN1807_c0_g1_i1.p1  ORF type:complete len:383 (-),score=46.10 TRINITY_DN1807_c0_g1_i1:14-1162(-)
MQSTSIMNDVPYQDGKQQLEIPNAGFKSPERIGQSLRPRSPPSSTSQQESNAEFKLDPLTFLELQRESLRCSMERTQSSPVEEGTMSVNPANPVVRRTRTSPSLATPGDGYSRNSRDISPRNISARKPSSSGDRETALCDMPYDKRVTNASVRRSKTSPMLATPIGRHMVPSTPHTVQPLESSTYGNGSTHEHVSKPLQRAVHPSIQGRASPMFVNAMGGNSQGSATTTLNKGQTFESVGSNDFDAHQNSRGRMPSQPHPNSHIQHSVTSPMNASRSEESPRPMGIFLPVTTSEPPHQQQQYLHVSYSSNDVDFSGFSFDSKLGMLSPRQPPSHQEQMAQARKGRITRRLSQDMEERAIERFASLSMRQVHARVTSLQSAQP